MNDGSMTTEVLEPALRLDRASWDRLVDHARSDDPYEVCGLLGIDTSGRIHHYPITNDERSMTYYVMNPGELLPAMLDIEDHGWDLVIYHSHPHTRGYPSATDIRLAAYPEATWVIITLQDRDAPDVRAFRIGDGRAVERRVELVG